MFKVILIVILSLFVSNVFASEGIDECYLVKEKILQNSKYLSLDEVGENASYYHGIEIDFQNYEYPYIIKTHPYLLYYSDFGEQDGIISALDFEFIHSINEELTLSMSVEEMQNLMENEEVSIQLVGSDKVWKLKKAEFYSRELFVITETKKIANINSKNSTFDAKLSLKINWFDNRFDSIFGEIYKKIMYEHKIDEQTDKGFYCKFEANFFKDLVYPLPEAELEDFFSTNPLTPPKNILIDYYPPSYCDSTEDEGMSYCSESQEKSGFVTFSLMQDFEGTFYSEMDLSKFPFDTNEIAIGVKIKQNVPLVFDDPIIAEMSDSVQQTDFYSQVNDEWNFIDFDQRYSSRYNSEMDTRFPMISLYFYIERKNAYYVYKIILPIVLLLFICWSTFWINPKELESRITISIVCLLSLIAYNFVVDNDLPKLGYLTFMDQFILISYFFAGIPTVQTVMSRYLYELEGIERAKHFDNNAKKIVPSLYIFALLLLFTSSGVLA